MPKDILLNPGRKLTDDAVKGMEFAGKEMIDEDDNADIMGTHLATYNHTDLHAHTNKTTLDAITDPGDGNIITASERAKLASIDATHYGAPLQTTVELSAIPQANIVDKERRYVEDELSDYFYDVTWSGGGTAPEIAPDDQVGGIGFWRQVRSDGETAASIKTKYESNANTNAFTDAEKSKLASIVSIGSGFIISEVERNRLNYDTENEYHVVSATDVTNGYFTLQQGIPFSGEDTKVFEANGIMQINAYSTGLGSAGLTPDWQLLSENQIHINNNGIATGLSGNIIEGDILCVCYRKFPPIALP